MYPIEYICTKDDTINTGINIETVKESKLKLQNTLSDSESIHLNKYNVTDVLFKPTSKNIIIANIVVIITELHVIICEPVIPTFLPKNPDIIDPNKGNTIIVKYIIYILLQCYLLIYKKLLKYLAL